MAAISTALHAAKRVRATSWLPVRPLSTSIDVQALTTPCSPATVVIEPGLAESAGVHMRRFGAYGRGLVVCSPRAEADEQVQPLQYFMRKAGLNPLQFVLPDGVPSTDAISTALNIARRMGCGFVVGMGTGGVLEAARMLAAMLAHNGDVREYSPDMGGERAFTFPSLPTIMVPTAPTSLELTTTAYALFKSEALFPLKPLPDSPRLVLADPSLYSGAPQHVIAMTAASTLAHASCSLVEAPHNSPAAAAASAAVDALLAHTHSAVETRSTEALTALAQASVLASAALVAAPGNAARAVGIGAVGRYRLPYSEVVGGMAPQILGAVGEAVVDAVDETDPAEDSPLGQAMVSVEDLLGRAQAAGGEGEEVGAAIASWASGLPLPSLSDHDLSAADFERMASSAEGDPTMLASAAPLARADLLEMYQTA